MFCWHFQVGAFSVLKELVVVLPDCLADHFGSLVPGIEKALNVSGFYFLCSFLCRIYVCFNSLSILLYRTNLLPPT